MLLHMAEDVFNCHLGLAILECTGDIGVEEQAVQVAVVVDLDQGSPAVWAVLVRQVGLLLRVRAVRFLLGDEADHAVLAKGVSAQRGIGTHENVLANRTCELLLLVVSVHDSVVKILNFEP